MSSSVYVAFSARARWIRAAVPLLVALSTVASCTTAPKAETRLASTSQPLQAPSTPAPLPKDSRAYYHFLLGYEAELNQDTGSAIREYQLALRSDPASVYIKSRLAVLYFSLGDMAHAVETADQLAQAGSRDGQLHIVMAGIYAKAGQSEKALRMYDRAIELDRNQSEAYFSKGVLLVNLKRLDEAERAFEQGIERSKDSPIGYYYLGRIEIEAKQFGRAIQHLNQAIQINPHFEPAYMALAALYETQQDRTGAIAVYRKYLQVINPQSKEMRHHLIRLFLQDKAYHDALSELDTLLREDPDDLDAQLRMGLVYGELKEYPKAIAQLTKILSARPAELRIRDYLGLMYEELKEYDKAIEAYQANLKLQPTYVDGHLHLGFLYYRLKQSTEAIPHLVEVVKQNPKQSDAYLLLGLTYLQSEQYASASQAFEEGIRYNPGNPDLLFNLGTAYDKLNRFDDVIRTLESALKLDPKHADTLNYLGYTYADRDMKIPEAVELTQRAVSLKPDNGYYVDSLAWALFKMGRLDDAKAEITKAATLVKDDPVIYEHLGEIYLKQNLRQEAKEAWLHSLELDPSNSKLIDRYKDRGFGDPTQEDRVREAKRRVSQNTLDHK
ncbi:MAG TPA: tetratricopeptide repeat protein [Nitrospiraceae bacterium]|nr:tetratricopeptide repeat protein [Nitrospiraceae bacterium]